MIVHRLFFVVECVWICDISEGLNLLVLILNFTQHFYCQLTTFQQFSFPTIHTDFCWFCIQSWSFVINQCLCLWWIECLIMNKFICFKCNLSYRRCWTNSRLIRNVQSWLLMIDHARKTFTRLAVSCIWIWILDMLIGFRSIRRIWLGGWAFLIFVIRNYDCT